MRAPSPSLAGIAMRALLRSLLVSVVMMAVSAALWTADPRLGVIVLAIWSAWSLLRSYRTEWRVTRLTCLLPALSALACLWIQVARLPDLDTGEFLPQALLGGAILGLFAGLGHKLLTRGAQVFARRTSLYLGMWALCFVLTQAVSLMGLRALASVALATSAFSTSMVAVLSLLLLGKYSTARRHLARAAIIVAFALGAADWPRLKAGWPDATTANVAMFAASSEQGNDETVEAALSRRGPTAQDIADGILQPRDLPSEFVQERVGRASAEQRLARLAVLSSNLGLPPPADFGLFVAAPDMTRYGNSTALSVGIVWYADASSATRMVEALKNDAVRQRPGDANRLGGLPGQCADVSVVAPPELGVSELFMSRGQWLVHIQGGLPPTLFMPAEEVGRTNFQGPAWERQMAESRELTERIACLVGDRLRTLRVGEAASPTQSSSARVSPEASATTGGLETPQTSSRLWGERSDELAEAASGAGLASAIVLLLTSLGVELSSAMAMALAASTQGAASAVDAAATTAAGTGAGDASASVEDEDLEEERRQREAEIASFWGEADADAARQRAQTADRLAREGYRWSAEDDGWVRGSEYRTRDERRLDEYYRRGDWLEERLGRLDGGQREAAQGVFDRSGYRGRGRQPGDLTDAELDRLTRLTHAIGDLDRGRSEREGAAAEHDAIDAESAEKYAQEVRDWSRRANETLARLGPGGAGVVTAVQQGLYGAIDGADLDGLRGALSSAGANVLDDVARRQLGVHGAGSALRQQYYCAGCGAPLAPHLSVCPTCDYRRGEGTTLERFAADLTSRQVSRFDPRTHVQRFRDARTLGEYFDAASDAYDAGRDAYSAGRRVYDTVATPDSQRDTSDSTLPLMLDATTRGRGAAASASSGGDNDGPDLPPRRAATRAAQVADGSAASPEAVNRMRDNRLFRVDTRTGAVTELCGVDAVDEPLRPHEVKVIRDRRTGCMSSAGSGERVEGNARVRARAFDAIDRMVTTEAGSPPAAGTTPAPGGGKAPAESGRPLQAATDSSSGGGPAGAHSQIYDGATVASPPARTAASEAPEGPAVETPLPNRMPSLADRIAAAEAKAELLRRDPNAVLPDAGRRLPTTPLEWEQADIASGKTKLPPKNLDQFVGLQRPREVEAYVKTDDRFTHLDDLIRDAFKRSGAGFQQGDEDYWSYDRFQAYVKGSGVSEADFDEWLGKIAKIKYAEPGETHHRDE